ncbi:exosome complex exonuclease-like protein Rrp40 [Aulographum hederae CBS 113979]|uniref:Exosome complex exonuclease-like protein Rrp40 n=1 Tax=Aulographum hederae CBS 113979 TaxID=1176131 RepID=A0A6G1HG77_9PEZI|nr:exosome complex exonuclease-like protein Rrp40 [Aulographum hederae CBS 113979]
MASTPVILPGDVVPAEHLPSTKKALTLGPGLRHTPPSTITATTAGALSVDSKKNAIWIEHNNGRYVPHTNDLIIATVRQTGSDAYQCAITPHTPSAILPNLAFEGATKKTRPQLASGQLVYARISSAPKHAETELECMSASSGKSEGMGPLKGGMVYDISLGMARRLMLSPAKMREQGLVVLEALAEKVQFEIAVGRNGRVWVDGGNVAMTLAVGTCIVETDRGGLDFREQRRLVEKKLKGV